MKTTHSLPLKSLLFILAASVMAGCVSVIARQVPESRLVKVADNGWGDN